MQSHERCYRTCLVYGRRWNIGDVRLIERFDEDGKPIVTEHFRLVEPGERVTDEELKLPKNIEVDREMASMRNDRQTNIRKALEQLDPDSNGDWTQKGQPSLQRVYAISRLDDIQRGDIVDAWPEFDREFAREYLKG